MKLFKKATKEAAEQAVEVVKEEAKKVVDKVGNDIWPVAACLLGGLLLVTVVKRPSVTVKVVVKHVSKG